MKILFSMPAFPLLLGIFLVLKMHHLIDWPWWVVLAPLYVVAVGLLAEIILRVWR